MNRRYCTEMGDKRGSVLLEFGVVECDARWCVVPSCVSSCTWRDKRGQRGQCDCDRPLALGDRPHALGPRFMPNICKLQSELIGS